ncbi:hypothetical protein [Paracoccus sp. PAR01]|uniref:hypothetical protein n=1 Tax=Paracoccus sp. PAR01 TaxID=2769282 RepID=UPI001784B126|nr:hypothetical protein [Paracoccus sp. PAR01]MBD9529091.1 hypothetical protein [Paracoccus sp. PAR01]
MSILEICAVICTALLALIYLMLRKLFQIIEHERTFGIGNRLHYAVDGIISLVGTESVTSNVGGTGWMKEVTDRLDSLDFRLETIGEHAEHLIPSRGEVEPYELWQAKQDQTS